MMEYQPPRAAFSASERPATYMIEAKQAVQAVIFGRLQDEGVLGGLGEKFGKALSDMYEGKSLGEEDTEAFRGLFEGITRKNMNEPEVLARISEIEQKVRAKMDEDNGVKRAA